MKNKQEIPVDISVIIPVYNAAPFLEQCLNSVLQQSVTSLQVICVDDSSTDESLEILKRYAKSDPRIVVLQQENKGAGAARNFGMTLARGKYTHFLDADDWLENNAYEELLNVIEESQADICVFLYTRYDNATGHTRNVKLFPGAAGSTLLTSFSERPDHFCNTSVVPWNKFYSTKFLKSINAHFDEIICANDRAFYYQTITQAQSVVRYSRYLINYRENNSLSLVGSARAKHFDCHLTANKRIFQIANEFPSEIYDEVFNTNFGDLFSFFIKSDSETKTENYRGICEMLAAELQNTNFDSFVGKSWYANAQIALLARTLNTEKSIIPIVFATDNNYAPFLDVAILSLLNHASDNHFYDIYIFHTGLGDSIKKKLTRHQGENYRTNCINLSGKINNLNLYSRAHYSKEMYYRIFIPELFYHLEKVLYLDCDLVINRDVAELYESDISEATVGAIHNMLNWSMYRYVINILHLQAEAYFNSGVLLINVDNFIREKIKTKCFDLLKVKENLVCPDQDLLNLACRTTAKLLDSGWNYQWHSDLPNMEKLAPVSSAQLNNARNKRYITHFTSGKKGWSYPECANAIEFWEYVDQSAFATIIKQVGLSKRLNNTYYDIKALFPKTTNQPTPSAVPQNNKQKNAFVEHPNSYRLGLFLTWFPRMFFGFFRCWHQHGLHYTLIRMFRGRDKAQTFEEKKLQKKAAKKATRQNKHKK